jgi:hypothetical protein
MTRTILSILALVLSFAASVDAGTEFELDDQYGKSHTHSDIFSGKPVIMFAGMERKTPDAMEAWDEALRAKAAARAKVVGLSNLEGVPFFVPKSSIKKTLVKQVPKTVVLCDWEGDIYSKLAFPKGATIAVAVFDATGKRLGLVTGEVDDKRMAEVLALLPE